MKKFALVLGLLLGLPAGRAWCDAPATGQTEVEAALLGSGPLDAAAVGRLIQRLGDGNAEVRQACERRLRGSPSVAAVPVVEALVQGKLAVRLSALAVLQAWKAPVEGLDPWQPETIAGPRMEELKNWAASGMARLPGETLDAAQLAAARSELDRMVAAPDPDAAEACCRRLTDYGPGLLPEVRARLVDFGELSRAAASTEAARERLRELRYRLAATDARLLGWAGGWARLASGDASVRRAAAGELIATAWADDAPLLLEVFSDPDPVLREMSLRALQRVGGSSANSAFMGLLRDSDPEVRAAVLKQLAEKPSPALAQALSDYAVQEKDVDLVCQAVRDLREIHSAASARGLILLLDHPAWRVRAETADALIEAVEKAQGGLQTQIYGALIKLLDDPDNFVVGRAVTGLKNTSEISALAALVRTLAKHPEMAEDIVADLVNIGLFNEDQKSAVAGELRKLCADGDGRIRAAALGGVAALAPQAAEAELCAGLKDGDGQVRAAAARGIFRVIEHGRDRISVQQFETFHNSHAAGAWFAKTVPQLQSMLGKEVDAANLAVALPLTAMGHEDQTMGLLLAAADKNDLRCWSIDVLPFLPWDKRARLYDALLLHRDQHKDVEQILAKMVQVTDDRGLGKVWELLDGRAATADDVNMVLTASRRFYWGKDNYDENDVSAAVVKKVAVDMAARAANGPELERTAALVLAAEVSPEDALPLAQKMMEDAASTQGNKLDAFVVLLASLSPEQAQKTAVQAFDWKQDFWYKAYVPFLALGPKGIGRLRGEIALVHAGQNEKIEPSGQPIVVTPPPGLSAKSLKALRGRADAAFVPMIDYLLCLCGDGSGFAPLAADWRTHHQGDDTWTSLVYRAAAVLNDDRLGPTLEEVYRSYDVSDSWELKKFYWTISAMTGPNVLHLRKKIANEVGMDNLR